MSLTAGPCLCAAGHGQTGLWTGAPSGMHSCLCSLEAEWRVLVNKRVLTPAVVRTSALTQVGGVRFRNQAHRPMKLYWVSHDGKPVTMAPFTHALTQTLLAHSLVSVFGIAIFMCAARHLWLVAYDEPKASTTRSACLRPFVVALHLNTTANCQHRWHRRAFNVDENVCSVARRRNPLALYGKQPTRPTPAMFTHKERRTCASLHCVLKFNDVHAMPCHAMPCHAMPCHAMPCLLTGLMTAWLTHYAPRTDSH
jgi:hypothetical protein